MFARRVILVIGLILAGFNTALAQPTSRESYAPYPAPDAGYVTDIAGVLDRDQEEKIERWLWQSEARTGVEIVVVTIRSMRDYPAAAGRNIESLTRGLFDRWKIGNMPANNGVLLVVAVEDRNARIELGAGYGRSRDADATAIMDNTIVPKFRDNDYAGGIEAGTQALMREFAGVRVGLNWPLISLIAGVPVVGLIAVSLFRHGKRGWGWVCVGLIAILLLAIGVMLVKIIRERRGSDSDSWSPGGFGGGFGGGFSGGGGATGSW